MSKVSFSDGKSRPSTTASARTSVQSTARTSAVSRESASNNKQHHHHHDQQQQPIQQMGQNGGPETHSGHNQHGGGQQTREQEFARMAVINTGPDGLRHHRRARLDPLFIGNVDMSPEHTSQVAYLFRAPKGAAFPKAKRGHIGETGYEVTHFALKRR